MGGIALYSKMKKKNVILTILLSLFSITMMAQTFTLQGRVTDSNNNPVNLLRWQLRSRVGWR